MTTNQMTVNAYVKPASSYIIYLIINESTSANHSFTSPDSKSSAVTNVSVLPNVTLRYLQIDWSKPVNSSGQIGSYLVRLSDSSGQCMNQWSMLCTGCLSLVMGVQDMINVTCTNYYNISFNISDSIFRIESRNISLNYADYNVFLVPINGYGWGSNFSMNFTTISYKVQNIRVTSNSIPQSLAVSWMPPAIGYLDVLQYVVWVNNVGRNNCVGWMAVNCTNCPLQTLSSIEDPGIRANCTDISNHGNFTRNMSQISVTFVSQSISRCSMHIASVAAITKYGWGPVSSASAIIGQCAVATFVCYSKPNTYNNFYCSWGIQFYSPILRYRFTYRNPIRTISDMYLSSGMSFIQVNDSVVPDVNYTCQIYACTAIDCGDRSETSIMLKPSIYPDINISAASIVMFASDKPSSPTQINVTLPYSYVTENLGRIVNFYLIVAVNTFNTIDNSPNGDIEKSYAECDRGKKCPYVITLTPPEQSTRVKRAVNAPWTSTDFTIGNNKDCLNVTNCNGPLEPNTKYLIGFRVCTSAGCLVIVTRKSTTFLNLVLVISIPSVVGILLIISVILLAIVLVRRKRRMSQSQRNSLIPRDQLDSMEVNHFEEYYRSMVKDSCCRASMQFLTIDQKLKELEKENKLMYCHGNEAKDRYNNVRPYVHNEVRLQNPDGYINASRICMLHCTTDSLLQCTCADCYIVTQGPIGYNEANKVPTIGDFWRMAHQYEVEIIVNLTNCVENYKEKCAQYWPDQVNVPQTYSSGSQDIEVTMVSMTSHLDYDERLFIVTVDGVSKPVTQLHLTVWPDHGCLNIDDFLEFYDRFRFLRGNTNTVIIHCSAGVGRSGSFILIDMELRKIASPLDKISIQSTLLGLRLSRCHMVQTEKQYVFAHSIIFEHLKRKGLISCRSEDKLPSEKLVEASNTYENPCFQ